MAKRLKITSLLLFLLLLAALALQAGCGGEKPVTEAQIADLNKPAEVYVVSTWEAEVSIPVLDVNVDALVTWATNEVLAGNLSTDETVLLLALIDELLRNPSKYIIASPTSDVSTRTVSSSGNGFLISPDGYVVTNAHIVKDDEDEIKALFAEDAAVDALLAELDALEQGLGFTLTEDQVDRFFAAAGDVYVTYMTVSDVQSKTNVYTGDIIDKAREEENGHVAEKIRVGDPLNLKEENGKDVAILKINAGSNLPTVNLGDESSVRDGDHVSAVTFISEKTSEGENVEAGGFLPKEDEPSLVTGTVAGRRKMEGGWDVLQLQIPLKRGSSGSPIFNNSGDVVAVETFTAVEVEEETGATEEIETQQYAIPVSIVKESMGLANVSASEGVAGKTYREGVELFHEQHYSAAKKKFEEVRNTNPDFPYIQDFITECQDNINKGLDKGTFPTTMLLILIVVLIVVAGVVLVVVLVILPRSKRKGPGPGGPGMPPPGGPGMPPGPGGPGMPGGPGGMPGAPGGGTPEAPTAPMPGAPGEGGPGAPGTGTPSGSPPSAPPGTPMPGSPEETGSK